MAGNEISVFAFLFFINIELLAEIPSKQRNVIHIINKGNPSLGGL